MDNTPSEPDIAKIAAGTTNEAAIKLAREVCAKAADEDGATDHAAKFRAGKLDPHPSLLCALAAILEVTERAAGLAYATCAETRHVTLGDKVATALRNMEHLS